jgi:hypothetical protein
MHPAVPALILAATLWAAPATAQNAASPLPVASGELARLLATDQMVRVQTTDGRYQTGRNLAINSREIQRAWVRGKSTKTGAIVGGITGLVGGALIGYLVTNPSSSPCDANNCTRTGVTVISGLLGAAAGTGAGAIVGSLIPKWRLRFP